MMIIEQDNKSPIYSWGIFYGSFSNRIEPGSALGLFVLRGKRTICGQATPIVQIIWRKIG